MRIICDVCNGCLIKHANLLRAVADDNERSYLFAGHTTLESLLASVRAQCNLCNSLWEELSSDQIKSLDEFSPRDFLTGFVIWQDRGTSQSPTLPHFDAAWNLIACFWENPEDWDGSPQVEFVLDPVEGMPARCYRSVDLMECFSIFALLQ